MGVSSSAPSQMALLVFWNQISLPPGKIYFHAGSGWDWDRSDGGTVSVTGTQELRTVTPPNTQHSLTLALTPTCCLLPLKTDSPQTKRKIEAAFLILTFGGLCKTVKDLGQKKEVSR